MKNQEEKLYDLVGKDWMYNRKNIRIMGILQKEGSYLIRAVSPTGTPEDLKVEVAKVEQFIKDCLPVNMVPDKVDKERDVAISIIQNSHLDINDLKQTLLDNIEKIKDDPAYIDQAKAISNNVNAIVSMTKLQFEVAKELKKG